MSEGAIVISKVSLCAIRRGSPDFYSVRLNRQCTAEVVIQLRLEEPTRRAIKLSTTRLYFNPDNYHLSQTVLAEALRLEPTTAVIHHVVVSGCQFYKDAIAPSVHITTLSNESTMIWSTGAEHNPIGTGVVDGFGRPHRVEGFTKENETIKFNFLSCGDNFTVVGSTQFARVFSWGHGNMGQLGLGSRTAHTTPQEIQRLHFSIPAEKPVIKVVSCGQNHVAAITKNGRLFTWGENTCGQLGYTGQTHAPKRVSIPVVSTTTLLQKSVAEDIAQHEARLRSSKTSHVSCLHVACGSQHTLVVAEDGRLYSMGLNKAGQLGLGHRLQASAADSIDTWSSCNPTFVDALKDIQVLFVAAGLNHSACITGDGDVYTFGCGADGRLGLGNTENYSTPQKIRFKHPLSSKPRIVCCGARHSAIVTLDGRLYTFGANECGQLGHGDYIRRTLPTRLMHPELMEDGVRDASLGYFHSACISSSGEVFTWGFNVDGGLGQGSSKNYSLKPTRVRDIAGLGAVKVSCGSTHTVVLTTLNEPCAGKLKELGILKKKLREDDDRQRYLDRQTFVTKRNTEKRSSYAKNIHVVPRFREISAKMPKTTRSSKIRRRKKKRKVRICTARQVAVRVTREILKTVVSKILLNVMENQKSRRTESRKSLFSSAPVPPKIPKPPTETRKKDDTPQFRQLKRPPGDRPTTARVRYTSGSSPRRQRPSTASSSRTTKRTPSKPRKFAYEPLLHQPSFVRDFKRQQRCKFI